MRQQTNNVTIQEAEDRTFKDTLRKINPKMGQVNVSRRHGELVDIKYGISLVGSFSSYQLSHTQSNFDVASVMRKYQETAFG